MKTAAVIVHWGPTRPTVELAASLDASPHVDQVVVVANDGQARPNELMFGVSWLVPPRNLGYGAAFRFAVDAGPSVACYLLLNNDVRISDAAIAGCLELLAHDGVGVVGPTLVNESGIQSAGARLSRVIAAPRAVADGVATHAADAQWVTGAAMFVKAACHRDVPMDGRYFLAFEDVDFCARVWQAGWRVVIAPVFAWHSGGATIPASPYSYYVVRNRLWYLRRHGRAMQTALCAAWFGAVLLPRAVLVGAARREGFTVTRLIWRGLRDGVSSMPPNADPSDDEPRPEQWTRWG